MSKKSLAAGTSPFAHLLAGFRGKRADDNTPEDDEARNARRAEEDQLREQEDARRAEEDQRRQDEDARRAEEDGTEGDGKPEGNRAEEDDEQDPEADAGDNDDYAQMDEDQAKAHRAGIALGRARENARCARIFGNAAAAGRPDLAATLAFTTRNTSAEAGRLLSTAGNAPAPTGRRQSIDQRMSQVIIPNPGTGGGQKPGAKSEVDDFVELAATAAKKAGIA